MRAGGIQHCRKILDQPGDPVPRASGRHLGCAGTTHVIGHDVVVGGELLDDAVPERVIVRISVHRDDRSECGVAGLEHRDPGAVGGDHAAGTIHGRS